jgi:hypothetical protein
VTAGRFRGTCEQEEEERGARGWRLMQRYREAARLGTGWQQLLRVHVPRHCAKCSRDAREDGVYETSCNLRWHGGALDVPVAKNHVRPWIALALTMEKLLVRGDLNENGFCF